ncbi:hypothetical protein GCM10008983_09960 [Lentibacillus halophilus]|uniref:RNA-directed DNA polymerase n=1 Tax=Lentibacillus halophilus TaxID=295065 RepID=A0ABN0Z6B4_9BACI
MDLLKLENEMIEKQYNNDYIAEVITYAKAIQSNGYNVIFDIKHLSLLTGISIKELYAFYSMKENLYKEFKIPKRSGGYRKIIAPSENLKYIQRWILNNILHKVDINPHATGFVSSRSIVTNAVRHVGKECVVNLDIKDFFPSITFRQVYSVFQNMGYSKYVSMFFSGFLTYRGVLPQGGPTSPILSNIVCNRLDERLANLALHINADYTRYADDITFSGHKSVAKYIKLIKNIIQDEGFEINKKKIRVQHEYHRQMVTGLIVNEILSVPRETKKYLRQQIYFAKKFGVSNSLRKQELEKTNYSEYLYGIAYFIKMVEKSVGETFIKELNQVDWES